MTKTFWAYWQKRAGETENIYLFTTSKTCHLQILNPNDKLIKITFNGDNVNLVIARRNWIIKNGNIHWNVQNEYITYNRTDIASIKFKK